MGRIFMLVNQPCYGESGGGHGIEYRLYRANKNEGIIHNVYYIFSDRVIKDDEDIGRLAKRLPPNNTKKCNKLLNKLKPGFLRALKIRNEYSSVCDYIRKLNDKFSFTDEDIYIFQDVKSAYAFTKLYNYRRCALIFHMQGSMYNEWKAFSGLSSKFVQKVFDDIFIKTINKVEYLCFPSKGALESLINSASNLKEDILKCKIKFLYNGVECPSMDYNRLSDEVNNLRRQNDYIFITVAVLNVAKAVERIPQFLGEIKKRGINFKWVLIGNGVMAPEVEKEINKNGIFDNVLWKKDFISHDQVLQMMSISDFYILFHRQSIFDLSTLEAMHYGCIPILTPVGGNNEMIVNDSGFFVDDFNNVTAVYDAIKNKRIEILKDKNIKLQTSMFDEIAMLKRYASLCAELNDI